MEGGITRVVERPWSPTMALPAGSVAAVVLAAGSSRRMEGRDKLYLEMAGESLLRRCVRQAIAARLDPVLVVAGPEPDRARRELADLSCRVVVNDDHAAGMGVSLACGVSHLPESASAFVALLADMPLVGPEMVREVVERHRSGRADLVISRYGDEIAPPILYGRALFAELRELSGDVGGKPVIRKHLDEAVVVEWSAELARDVDVAEDAERLREPPSR